MKKILFLTLLSYSSLLYCAENSYYTTPEISKIDWRLSYKEQSQKLISTMLARLKDFKSQAAITAPESNSTLRQYSYNTFFFDDLLEQGLNINALCNEKDQTFLHIAIQYQKDAAAFSLLKKGALQLQDRNGNTPLMLIKPDRVTHMKHTACSLLTHFGADTNSIKNKLGQTAADIHGAALENTDASPENLHKIDDELFALLGS